MSSVAPWCGGGGGGALGGASKITYCAPEHLQPPPVSQFVLSIT